eukprot:TRINITY_DN3531_c0_g2_i9.p1 TRINITY_DN3531_c0_g2~~TRINITY_DN3531_c0_g2_i9.p1  ORF type:complete len:535 (-),score=115.84 TRINITY_DN3531_c0_g2_i9:205-1809(-)
MKNRQPSDIWLDICKEYPSMVSGRLSDSEVFHFLLQFVDSKKLDPSIDSIKRGLQKDREREELQREQRKLNSQRDIILAKYFPDRYRLGEVPMSPTDTDRFTKLDDPGLIFSDTPFTSTAHLVQKLEGMSPLSTEEILTRDQFFFNVNTEDEEAMRNRERQWKKYSELLKLQRLADSQGETTADEEPVVDAATSFRKLFREKSLGKYVKFSAREQKKYLPEGWCGMFEHREFERTKETSLMLRRPSLLLVEHLKKCLEASFARDAPMPALLCGRGGSGKSACLQFAVYWARKSGWLVINIKNATKWAHSGLILNKSRTFPGCWDQPFLGSKFLEHMLDAHTDKLKVIPLRTEFVLGKFSGKTLYDLVEYGAALQEYSCEVVYRFKKELERVLEFPVLIAIDDYNSLYNYNQAYRDPECTHWLPRKLRNENLTLCRIFKDCHVDHRLVNGTMIGALSREASYRHFRAPVGPEDEENARSSWILVDGLDKQETDRMFDHYERTGYVLAKTTGGTREVMRQLTNGNPAEIWRWCRSI